MRFFSKTHKEFVENLIEKIMEAYGKNLVSIVIFGSYERGENKTTSDIDMLIVLEKAHRSRKERLKEFEEKVEKPLSDLYEKLFKEIYVLT
ncbi:nucleotidyltransferase family protein [Ferroglobus placidus]|uniref:nucleotidyltransferase family protein n=1 Tax=Ferroglobus placidus TaxID=54261 RepID=UPI0001B75CFB|nr:nucleotidyltransferase domain-containing protein [Ferroglobus placidus]